MISYLFYRLFLYIPTLLIIIFIVFILMRVLPGDPIRVMYGELEPPPEVREELERKLGLDKPLILQYVLYVMRVLQGDWGKSVAVGEPVLDIVLRRFQATLELAISSMMLASIIGLMLGLVSVWRPNSTIDKMVRVVSVASYSLPVFWWGLLLILIFSIQLRWLPPGGRGELEHLVLPTLTLSIVNFGMIARVARASMLEIAVQDFVLSAKARGLSELRVLLSYIMRNALIPIITLIGLRFGGLLGGAVITETIFKYPGLGSLIYDAIFSRDYPIVFGGILFVAFVVMTVNLFVDLIYYVIDPRIRLEKSKV